MQSPTSGWIRPFREDDEAALRGIMKASLEVDAFPGFSAWDLDCEAVSIMGAPDGVAVAIEDGEADECRHASTLPSNGRDWRRA